MSFGVYRHVFLSFVDMELELPKHIYGEGFEPQVKKNNNSCRMEFLRDLKKATSEEYEELKRDKVFTHIMAIQENGLKFSGKPVHSFLCKELITSKMHEKWFIFAMITSGVPCRKWHQDFTEN